MATYQQCFCGEVERSEHFQPVASIKWRVVTATDTDGNPVTYSEGYNVFTAKVTEETFRFEGLSLAQAHATDSQTVTDVGGVSHTVPFAPALTQPTYDELSWEKNSVSVQRARISPHMWAVAVHVRSAVLYVNGVVAPNQG